MDQKEIDELKKQIIDAVLAQEDKLNELSDSVDKLVFESEKKFDEEVVDLDKWFESMESKTQDSEQGKLQIEYKEKLKNIHEKIQTDLKNKLLQLKALYV